MAKVLETLSVLPQGDGGRFGSIAIGSDRVNTIRDEHLALRSVAAELVLGKSAEQLTLDDLRHVADIIASRSKMTPEALETAVKDAAMALLTDPAGILDSGAAIDTALWLLAAKKARTS